HFEDQRLGRQRAKEVVEHPLRVAGPDLVVRLRDSAERCARVGRRYVCDGRIVPWPSALAGRRRETAVHVAELCRHPVKSLQGESLHEAVIEDSGMAGDRRWGIVECEHGMVLTGRRVPSLLLASSRLTDSGVELVLPDGDVLNGPSAHADDVLSEWIGRRVALVHAGSIDAGVGEFFQDATDDNSAVVSWRMPAGRFVDALPLLVLTTASLRQGRALHPDGAWETRRFRPNV